MDTLFFNLDFEPNHTRLDLEWGGNAGCLILFVCVFLFGACYSRQRMGLKCLMPTIFKIKLKCVRSVVLCFCVL